MYTITGALGHDEPAGGKEQPFAIDIPSTFDSFAQFLGLLRTYQHIPEKSVHNPCITLFITNLSPVIFFQPLFSTSGFTDESQGKIKIVAIFNRY